MKSETSHDEEAQEEEERSGNDGRCISHQWTNIFCWSCSNQKREKETNWKIFIINATTRTHPVRRYLTPRYIFFFFFQIHSVSNSFKMLRDGCEFPFQKTRRGLTPNWNSQKKSKRKVKCNCPFKPIELKPMLP